MGLFDFFRRKPPPPPDPEPGPIDEPRCQHYVFAHYALRSLALEEPLAYLGILASPDARPFLTRVLSSVLKDCKEGPRPDPHPVFGVEDLELHPVRAGRFPCLVVQMPEPRATTEAFFTAAVLLGEPAPDGPPPRLRYFTLEKGADLGGPPRTVLCEWTAQSHINYGDGPAPKLEAFLRAVEQRVAQDDGSFNAKTTFPPEAP